MDRLPKKLPFSSKALRVKVVLSYIFDYAIIIILVGAFYLLDAIEPFHQPFSLKNYTLRYPYADPERVSIPLALLLAGVAPAGIIAIYTMVIDGIFSTQKATRGWKKYPLKSRLWELNCGILGLLLGVGASFVITAALKNAIGKPRPDLIARCKPRPEDEAAFLQPNNFTLAMHSICTQTDNAILKDGFRSFPSGHSSASFGGLFYLSLYLCGKLHILDSRGEVWKTVIVLIPTLAAALIAGSRIMDARHHPFDVITGSMLGIATAWVAYRQYFPPLSDFRAKGRAYPIRTWGTVHAEMEDDMDRLPLKAGMAESGYVTGREVSPNASTSNAFRDEIDRSQRRRMVDGAMPSDSVDRLPPQYGAGNPFGGAASRQPRRDQWEDSSDDAENDLELQPQYGRGATQAPRYDPPPSGMMSQDTSYAAYKPTGAPSDRLPRADTGGDLGSASVTATSPPPAPPTHGQSRGVQLTESYAK